MSRLRKLERISLAAWASLCIATAACVAGPDSTAQKPAGGPAVAVQPMKDPVPPLGDRWPVLGVGIILLGGMAWIVNGLRKEADRRAGI